MRVPALALLAIACGSGEPSGTSNDPPPHEATLDPTPPAGVARRFADRVRALDPDVNIDLVDARHLVVNGEEVDIANLGAECQRAGDACDAAIDRWARSMITPAAPASREAVRAVVFPARACSSSAEHPVLGRPFVGPLCEAFVLDEPDRITHLTSNSPSLVALGNPSLDELHALSQANMRAAFAADMPSQPFEPDVAPNLRVIAIGDSYENSRVLLHERWAPIAQTVQGQLLVAAPARDVVIYTGSANERDVAALRWLAQQMTQHEPHPIAPAILRWTPERWELFHANDREDPAIAEILRGAPR